MLKLTYTGLIVLLFIPFSSYAQSEIPATNVHDAVENQDGVLEITCVEPGTFVIDAPAEDLSNRPVLSVTPQLFKESLFASKKHQIPEAEDLSNRTVLSITPQPFRESLFASKKNQTPDPVYRASQAMFIGAIAADLGTTWNLSKGMTEGNPLLGRNKPQQISVSAAMATFSLWSARSLYSKGNTKAAKWLLWTGTAVHGFAAIYNSLQ